MFIFKIIKTSFSCKLQYLKHCLSYVIYYFIECTRTLINIDKM